MFESLSGPSRRTVLTASGAGLIAAVLAPRLALADEGAVAAEIAKLYADRPITPGRVKLDLPQIAENGLVVPLNVEVDSPMTAEDHVVALHVFANGNPFPTVITYQFTPMSGKAAASTRIRLAQTQTILAIAELSDGSLHSAKADVKVTVGGCGG